jgi:DNA-binding MarR family transcriptional regulator
LAHLRELPTFEILESEARRYETHDAKLMASYLTLVIVGAELQAATDAALAKHKLTRGRFLALIILRHSPDKTSTPAELAARSSVTSATMTGLLDGLTRDKLVARARRRDDRRSVSVTLTKQGEAVLDGLLPTHYARIAKTMGALTATERASLTTLLSKLRAGIEPT